MAVWYEVEKSENGINTFLECNWYLHDFRLEWVRYIAVKDMVEVYLRYDTGDMGVLLRFAWVHDYHVNVVRDYDADWMDGSVLIPLKNGHMIWIDTDTWGELSKDHIDELKKNATWVEAERLLWAITDGAGNPVEMPVLHIDQEWCDFRRKIYKHFELKELDENWDDILRPPYWRKEGKYEDFPKFQM